MEGEKMKSYALFFFLLLLGVSLLLGGCGGKETTEQVSEETTAEESEIAEIAAETPVLDEVTDAEVISDDLSLNTEEDDYGDII